MKAQREFTVDLNYCVSNENKYKRKKRKEGKIKIACLNGKLEVQNKTDFELE